MTSSSISWHTHHPILCYYRWYSILGLGALTALALPPVYALPILLFTFGLFGHLLNTLSDWKTDWKKATWAGFLFGFGFYATGLYWLINAVMIRADQFWWFIPFPSIGCALILAPTVAIPAALSLLVPAGIARLLLFSATWTLADMSRTFIFSGFTWNSLGSSMAIPGIIGNILIQPAAWIGEDGLTLFLVLFSTLCGTTFVEALPSLQQKQTVPRLSSSYRNSHRTQILYLLYYGIGFITLWVSLGTWRYLTAHPSGKAGPIVVIVQGNVPETDKIGQDNPRDIFIRYLTLTAQGIQKAKILQASLTTNHQPKRSIVFLWPETSFPGYDLLQDSPLARAIIMRESTGAQAGFIGAIRRDNQGRYRNSLFALAPDGSIEAVYDKARLVPFGEYQPPFIPLQIVPNGGLAAGPGPQTWHLAHIPAVGPLICYEVIFSGEITNRKDRPRWFANVTNDAWFGNSAGPRQHLTSVRLRAVEEGLPIARAANTGISAVYNGLGQCLGFLKWGKKGVLVAALPPALPCTLFGHYGQMIPLLLCGLILFIAFYMPKLPKKIR